MYAKKGCGSHKGRSPNVTSCLSWLSPTLLRGLIPCRMYVSGTAVVVRALGIGTRISLWSYIGASALTGVLRFRRVGENRGFYCHAPTARTPLHVLFSSYSHPRKYNNRALSYVTCCCPRLFCGGPPCYSWGDHVHRS